MKKWFSRNTYKKNEIDPDEVLLDATNLPDMNTYQFEGRLERPIKTVTIFITGIIFCIVALVFSGRIYALQISNGEEYREIAENNRLLHKTIFSDRGVIYDRNGELLAWNEPKTETDYNLRHYIDKPGFAHLLGYVDYPKKDSSGNYFETETVGVSALEAIYDNFLAGQNGLQLEEVNALQKTTSASLIRNPENGESLHTTIDAKLQELLFKAIKDVANEVGFEGGAGAIMDIRNGEIIALTSYPEYNSNIMTERKDSDTINSYFSDERNIFLNRMTKGVYTPGSIVKPFVALGALQEGVINQNTVITSSGSITVPNPYFPDKPSVFKDWKAHGPLTVRGAIANSSNVFLYQIGGGFGSQKGIGIEKVEKYVRAFGYGAPFLHPFFEGPIGTIPNPEWKEKTFDGDPWRLGDTYFTSIGQYGFQITPMQALRGVSGIATKGKLVQPHILKDEISGVEIIPDISESNIKIIQEGMRQGALDGTARSLNVSYVSVAAKTGTAELGVNKEKVNSWVTGYYPYEDPKYAFVIMMEKGSRANLFGAPPTFRRFLDSVYIDNPNYFLFSDTISKSE